VAFAAEQGFDASIELDVSELERYLAAPTTTSLPTLRRLSNTSSVR
jgi:hypothetical protein